MIQTDSTDQPANAAGSCNPTTATTRALLGYGAVAGPFYLTVSAIHGLAREGFDFSRHQLSLLATGDLGWIQIANFVVTGLMVVAAAVGIRRVLRSGVGATWGPRLIGAFGVGLLAGGVFVADPMDGFPVGTPPGPPATVSWHGMLHLAAGGVSFLCLVAATFVIARRLANQGQRRWAVYSRITGVVFFTGFAAVASGATSSVGVLALWIGVVAAWAWLGALSVHLYRRVADQVP